MPPGNCLDLVGPRRLFGHYLGLLQLTGITSSLVLHGLRSEIATTYERMVRSAMRDPAEHDSWQHTENQRQRQAIPGGTDHVCQMLRSRAGQGQRTVWASVRGPVGG